jgi:hypothetical protein
MTAQVQSYDRAVAVTKSDSTVLNCAGFYVGGAGNVAIQSIGNTGQDSASSADTAVTLTACIVGTIYPIACARIMSTNTTATNIVALY